MFDGFKYAMKKLFFGMAMFVVSTAILCGWFVVLYKFMHWAFSFLPFPL